MYVYCYAELHFKPIPDCMRVYKTENVAEFLDAEFLSLYLLHVQHELEQVPYSCTNFSFLFFLFFYKSQSLY